MRRSILGSTTVLLALAVVVVGCGGDDDDAPTPTTQALNFQADVGTNGEELIDLGGLTLKGYCRLQGDLLHLSLTATTATDDSVLGSRFTQDGSTYDFFLDDFDSDFGEYDVMGKASDETSGTLTYVPAEGGAVTVDYTAVQETPQADCVVGGIATHAP